MSWSLQGHLRDLAGFDLPVRPVRPAQRNGIGGPLVHEDETSVVRLAAALPSPPPGRSLWWAYGD